MIRKYDEVDALKLQAHSELVFEEISGGIYYIGKDRYEVYFDRKFASADSVMFKLCEGDYKIVIKNVEGAFYANFDS